MKTIEELELELSAKTAWLDCLLLLKKEADRIVAHVCGGLEKPGNTEDKLSEAFDYLIRSNQQNMEALETNIPVMKDLYKFNQEFTDTIDLMRDEFQRIKACPGVTNEIKGLCERAISGIHQRVPVIVQRDQFESEVIKLRHQIENKEEQRRVAWDRETQIRILLHELHALVKGECPSLLDEDSDGLGRLDLEIKTALGMEATQ